MRAIFACLSVAAVFACSSPARAQGMALEFGNLKAHFTPPEGFMRFDDTGTMDAESVKAVVPPSNHMLAAFTAESNILERKENPQASGYPWFMFQAYRAAVTGDGIGGFSLEKEIDRMAGSFAELFEGFDADRMEKIRAAIDKQARARLGEDFKLESFAMKPTALISKSEHHVTILISGRTESKGTVGGGIVNTVGTFTIMGVDSLPLFIYAYGIDDGTPAAVKAVIELTERIREGVGK